MAWPTTPHPLTFEAWIGNQWRDITSDVQQRSGITINDGTGSDASSPSPAECSFALNNRSGKYSPNNVNGVYFGQLQLLNTPMRLAYGTDFSDAMSATVANSWGTTDGGYAWSGVGSGAPVLATDFNKAGGFATHLVPASNGYRVSRLMASSVADAEALIVFKTSVAAVTGGTITASVMFRGSTTTPEYYDARAAINPSGVITLQLARIDAVGTYIFGTYDVPGLTYTGTTQLIALKVCVEGTSMRAKAWDYSASGAAGEPMDWQLTASDSDGMLTKPGYIAVRSAVSAANTNAKPITFSYDQFTVRIPMFYGEIPEWPQRWDTTGVDAFVNVTAAGSLRRWNQDRSVLQSTMRRAMTAAKLTNKPVAYWPCEDADGSTFFASALPGKPNMIIGGSPDLASDDGFASSSALPVLTSDSQWVGQVAGYTATGTWQARFYAGIPTGGIAAEQGLISFYTNGTAAEWRINLDTLGNLKVLAYDRLGTNILSSTIAFDMNGKRRRVQLDVTNSGSDVTYNISAIDPGASGGTAGGTLAGYNVGNVTKVVVSLLGGITGVTVGHISVQPAIDGLFTLANEFGGWVNEGAGARMTRLGQELGRPIVVHGDPDDTALGPQAQDNFIGLVLDAAKAGQGILTGSRSGPGLLYITRRALYDQTPIATASLSAGELHTFNPVMDDSQLVNSYEAQRDGGSSAVYTQTDGPLGTATVGEYPDSGTLNLANDSQLARYAEWRVALGTSEDPSFPDLEFWRQSRAVMANPTLSAALLAARVGTVVRLTSLGHRGFSDDLDVLIAQRTDSVNRFEHGIRVRALPARPYMPLMWDAADPGGRWDSTDSTVGTAVNAAATTLSVAVAGPVLWTTDPAHFPFDIRVRPAGAPKDSGERMTVTNITGASSPQTFTVTRNVNGAGASHAVGDVVTLFKRATWAL